MATPQEFSISSPADMPSTSLPLVTKAAAAEEEEVEAEEVESGDHSTREKNHKMGAIALITRFRLSFSRRRRRRSSSYRRSSSIIISDFRHPKEQQNVEQFRKLLSVENLLPPKLDDYHTLLRYFISNF